MLIAVLCLGGVAMLLGPTRLARPVLRTFLGVVRGPIAFVRQRLARPAAGPDVAAFCDALAAELRCGTPADRALDIAGGRRAAPQATAAAVLGEPVPPALAADAEKAESAALAAVAACWSAAADGGAGLADGVDRAAALARAEQRIQADLATETAGPRATARTLATLPLIGVGLGQVLGANPVAWLLGTGLGRGCLALALLLQGGGLLWSRRIVARAQPQPLTASA